MALKLLEEAQQEAAKLDASAPSPEAESKTRGKQRGHGPAEQSNLPRVPLLCELGEADRACPQCGDHMKPLAREAERSEMIDVVELKYQIVEVTRQKYVCGRGGAPSRRRPGPRALSRAIATRCASRSRWPSTSTSRTCRSSVRCG